MDQLTAFYELKKLVLLRYQETYPYVYLDWKTFSSKDILQLIEDIEENTKQRISEKWIYTHLKPEFNEKIPRKDLLDILATYVRYESWDAFAHQISEPLLLEKKPQKQRWFRWWILPFIGLIALGIYFSWKLTRTEIEPEVKVEPIEMKDFHTGEAIEDSAIHLFVKEKGVLAPLESKEILSLKPETEIVVESPFYAEAKVEKKDEKTVLVLKADDYAMRLKAFIQSDIKDWETRKAQLNDILSDELEVLIHLQNNLGIEYMNKEEFAKKLIIPTKTIKNWQILSLEQDASQKITKIRIKQN
ncbi:MAG: hypothetical protein PHQ74_00850 [Crocinitomicaceae bacterium]|nr:hypothetical protein [Crocinitomicaceae bacterium]